MSSVNSPLRRRDASIDRYSTPTTSRRPSPTLELQPLRSATVVDEEDDEDYADADDEEALLSAPEARLHDEERKPENLAGDDPASLIRRAVPETDDVNLPALTARAVLLGTAFACLGAAVSQLFFYRSNSPSFSSYFIILISLPLGRWLARVVPHRTVRIPLFGDVALNPGPFNMKEHVLIAVISSSGATSAYASDIINVQDLFFNQQMSILASLTLLLSTQTLGFGFAGLLQSVLVKPVAMIFPSTLVTTTMFHTLHGAQSADTRPRLRFFMFAFIAVLIYQTLPNLLAPTLSSVAVLCLLNNENKVFTVLSSGFRGFGILNFSFDWSAVGASGPLYTPLWAALNYYAGFAGAMYLVMPILYFSNFWQAQRFASPINAALYDHVKYEKFDVMSVLSADNTLDDSRWAAVTPVYTTPWFALSYGISFATLTSMISHVLLWYGGDIKRAMFARPGEDYHARQMRNYPAVPRSWYLTILAVSLGAAIILVATTPLQLPVWGLLLAVLLASLFLVPVGLIKAISDTSIGLNVVTEFVWGLLSPGSPVGNATFKCFGYLAMGQALDLTVDLKLSHYLKIPPRHMFLAQLLGTVVGAFVNLAVLRLVLNPDAGYRAFLTGEKIDPSGQWDGRKVHIFFSATIIWGAIGPARFFVGAYKKLYWGFFIGAIGPVIPWLLNKRWRHPYWRLINFPVILHAAGLPPQTPNNVIASGFIAAMTAQWWMRKHHPKFFAKRIYVLSAALDAGSSVNALLVFVLSITLLKAFPGLLGNWFLRPALDAEHCTPEPHLATVGAT